MCIFNAYSRHFFKGLEMARFSVLERLKTVIGSQRALPRSEDGNPPPHVGSYVKGETSQRDVSTGTDIRRARECDALPGDRTSNAQYRTLNIEWNGNGGTTDTGLSGQVAAGGTMDYFRAGKGLVLATDGQTIKLILDKD
jgi:hypothetical protein